MQRIAIGIFSETLPSHCMTAQSGLYLVDASWLLEQIVADSPSITTLPPEQFTTSHIKDLPTIEPHCSLVFSVCLLEMRPNLLLACIHFC